MRRISLQTLVIVLALSTLVMATDQTSSSPPTVEQPSPGLRSEINATYAGSTLWQGISGICVKDNQAYLLYYFGVVPFDVSNPSAPIKGGDFYMLDHYRFGKQVDNYIYSTSIKREFSITDIANPGLPVVVSRYQLQGFPGQIDVVGNYAYVPYDSTLEIIDISNPSAPTSVVRYRTVYPISDVAVIGNYAYLACQGSGLVVLNITNPAAPLLQARILSYGEVTGTERLGTRLLISGYLATTYILDITAPISPVILGTFGTCGFNTTLAAYGDYLFGASGDSITVVNISNPTSPAVIHSWHVSSGPPYGVSSIVVTGNRLFYSAWNSGFLIYDITDVTQPALLSSYQSLEYMAAYDVEVQGSYAFVASSNGLNVIDISDPSKLTPIASLDLPYAEQIVLGGNYAYIRDYYAGLHIADISNPSAPALINTFDTPGYAWDIAVSGNYLYVADQDSGLQVVDVSNPSAPTLVNTARLGYVSTVFASGNYVYVGISSSGMKILDVSDPLAPILVGSYSQSGQRPLDLKVAGGYAYFTDRALGLLLFDVSNPSSPTLRGSYLDPDIWMPYLLKVTVSGNYAYLSAFGSGLKIINIANPSSPYLASTYSMLPGWATNCDIAGGYVYQAADNAFLRLSLSTPVCGDVDESGSVDISDAIAVIQCIFGCDPGQHLPAQADVNCDNSTDISDVVYLITYIFGGGPAPCAGCK